jgi:hypothetical protein
MSFSLYGRWYDFRRNLAGIFSAYWHYRPNRWYFFLSLGGQIFLWFLAYRLFALVGGDLFVSHYNVDFGIDGVGSSRRAFIAPAAAAAVLLLNVVAALSFSKRAHFHFISHAGGLSSLAAQILAALALMSLYLINFLA